MPEGHLQARHFDLRSAAGESACLPPAVITGLSCHGRSNRALCHAEGERRAGSAISTEHLCQGIWKRTGFARLQANGDNDHFGISHQLFIGIDDHLF